MTIPGEVYKANDTRLDRTVAIKVLLEHLAESPERKARFEREAKAISQLNHPHICTLFDVGEQDGIDYLVMEYIEGETLAERLKRGPLPLDKALEYGIQIVDGLDAAHRAGIVHRDLKPGNAMLTKSGIKLLDFGLAKVLASEEEPGTSDAPTRQRDLTKEQSIIGTLQYMAPEQLEGKTADARTDIFAFGAVLYEMLTGNKAFEGDSQASLITAIMSSEPRPPSESSPLSPAVLDRVVTQCLTKDPGERLQSAHDVKLQLETIDEWNALPRQSLRQGFRPAWIAAMVVATAVVTGLVVSNGVRRHALPERAATRFTIELPSIDRLGDVSLALSPDGTGFVYVGSRDGFPQLFHRAWNGLESEPLQDTDGAVAPFYSPDGTWVGFAANGQLKKVPRAGGPSVVLCEAPGYRGGSWGPDGTIVFASSGSGLKRVTSAGGVPEPITTLDDERGEIDHLRPSFLPNGKAVLFTVRATKPFNQVAILELETRERRLLMHGESARYLRTGHLVYVAGRLARGARFDESETLLAVAFDVDGLEATGEPVAVVEGVQGATPAYEFFDIGSDGTLVYVPTIQGESTLVWVDRGGRQTPIEDDPAMYRHPRLGPDATRAAWRSHREERSTFGYTTSLVAPERD